MAHIEPNKHCTVQLHEMKMGTCDTRYESPGPLFPPPAVHMANKFKQERDKNDTCRGWLWQAAAGNGQSKGVQPQARTGQRGPTSLGG